MEGNDRKRLARLVIARRVELGMHTTKALAKDAGLSPRMLGDVENGRRDNFSSGAKAQIERALRWDPGSIDAILRGGDPTTSGEIRDRSGRALSSWTAIEGAEQDELELYRLTYLIADTRDLARSQKSPLLTALTALLDEAAELTVRRLARWRTGTDVLDAKDLEDAQWFLDQTRTTNTLRRQGDIYVVDVELQPSDPAAGTGAFLDASKTAEMQASDSDGPGVVDHTKVWPPPDPGWTPGLSEPPSVGDDEEGRQSN